MTTFANHPQFPGYRIGDDGTVWTQWKLIGKGRGRKAIWDTSRKWKELKYDIDDRGRKRVYLRFIPCKYIHRFVSVLVLEAFVGPRPPRLQGCHNDGNVRNNTKGNLRWDTAHKNSLDKIRHGTMLYGSKNNRSKLTEEQVLQIRHRRFNGELGTTLGKEFNVTSANISTICLGYTWPHVGGPRTPKEYDGQVSHTSN